jgi:hypothetical protein
MVIALVWSVTSVVALATLGRDIVERTRARTAADAAALASVDGRRADAERLADEHGGVVVTWRREPGGHDVMVEVRVGDATARARASSAP